MPFIQKTIISFLFFFVLTVIFSYWGDDDVIYKFIDRKPTGKEAIARIRYVMSKIFSSIYRGRLLAWVVRQLILKGIFSLTLTENQSILLIVFCMAIAYVLIGVVQNIIRYMRGRQQRLLFDPVIIRYLLKSWTQPRF